MKFVVTLMVRDEVDIIAAMVEHHLDQGAALVIATDNGSVDGTTEVLQQYADLGVLELHHDPVHRKQQGVLVTAMARRAFTEHGADWVVNADADEFWIPVDRSLTLQQCFEQIPTSLQAFNAPVVNMVGDPAQRGSGIDRLVWRDLRSPEQLQAVGIFAQPTPNAVHVGSAEVKVSQGNHFVSLTSQGDPDPGYAIEVLHLPWRSWEQLERKVVNTGLSYEASPDLRPSKNHHGMQDYRRHQGGRLRYTYLLRLPPVDALAEGVSDGWAQQDRWLRDHLHGLVGRARRPELLAACLDADKDEPIEPAEHRAGIAFGRMLMDLEIERDQAIRTADEKHRVATRIAQERDTAREELARLHGNGVLRTLMTERVTERVTDTRRRLRRNRWVRGAVRRARRLLPR